MSTLSDDAEGLLRSDYLSGQMFLRPPTITRFFIDFRHQNNLPRPTSGAQNTRPTGRRGGTLQVDYKAVETQSAHKPENLLPRF